MPRREHNSQPIGLAKDVHLNVFVFSKRQPEDKIFHDT